MALKGIYHQSATASMQNIIIFLARLLWKLSNNYWNILFVKRINREDMRNSSFILPPYLLPPERFGKMKNEKKVNAAPCSLLSQRRLCDGM